MTREEILAKLKESIVEMDEDLAEEAAHEALEAGLDPLIAITDGLSEGMLVVSDLFDKRNWNGQSGNNPINIKTIDPDMQT